MRDTEMIAALPNQTSKSNTPERESQKPMRMLEDERKT
jgi:hypothetical protein